MNSCSRCGPAIYDDTTGEMVCPKCGRILGYRQTDYIHSSTQNTATGRELGGYLGRAGHTKDATGKMIHNKEGIHRQRIQQNISLAKANPKSVRVAKDTIGMLVAKLSLPDYIRIEAEELYCIYQYKKGRSIREISAAVVLAAARRARIPRSMTDVGKALNINKKRIGKNYRLICKHMGITPIPQEPDVYVAGAVSRLGLPEYIARKASDILHKAREDGITVGKSPSVLAATAIYLAAEKISSDTVAGILGVSPASVLKNSSILGIYVMST